LGGNSKSKQSKIQYGRRIWGSKCGYHKPEAFLKEEIYDMTKVAITIISMLLALLLLASCEVTSNNGNKASTPPNIPTAYPIEPEPSLDSTAPATETDEHAWKGHGYRYTSEALGITIEFPPEWKWILDILEINGGISLYTYPRPRDPQEYAFTGNIGWIGVIGTQERDTLINSNDWSNYPYQVLYDAEGVFVYISYPTEAQYYSEFPEDAETEVRYTTVENGIRDGEYEIYIIHTT